MKYRGIIIGALLVGAAVWLFMTLRANKEIQAAKNDADSVAGYWHQKHNEVHDQSELRQDSLDYYKNQSKSATSESGRVDTLIKRIVAQGPASTSTFDSLRYVINLDSLKTIKIAALIRDTTAKSRQIFHLTEDRDAWKHDADSLDAANQRLHQDVKKIARAASTKVNLGFMKVPLEVLIGAGSAGLGYVIGRASSPSPRDGTGGGAAIMEDPPMVSPFEE